MAIAFTTWTEIYTRLFRQAVAHRGLVIANPDTADAHRWPHTHTLDAAALLAFFDRAVARVRPHAAAVWQHWEACVEEVATTLATAPAHTAFPGNRALWRCLATTALLLDQHQLAVPAAAQVAALLRALRTPWPQTPPRNAPRGTPPFARAGLAAFEEVWLAQFQHVRAQRGFDTAPGNRILPRATNADVATLAAYWTQQLAAVKPVMGRAAILERWAALQRHIATATQGQPPTATFTRLADFWRTSQDVAVHVAVADEAPTQGDLALAALKTSVGQLPQTLAHTASVVADGVTAGAGAVADKLGTFLRRPLLLGGGALGLYLVLRGRLAGQGA